MKRMLFLAVAVVFAIAFAMPHQEAGAVQQGNGKGKGGGGNKEETISVGQMTLHDNHPGTRLLSDGKQRTGPDSDIPTNDGFLELVPSMDAGGLVLYQAYQLPFDDPGNGIHPDPCTQLFVDGGGGESGRARALFNYSGCSIETPVYDNDVRTFTLVFDKETSGGACACDALSYLVDANGDPADMFSRTSDGEPAQTTFDPVVVVPGPGPDGEIGTADDVEIELPLCALTPAVHGIVTDSDHNLTGGQQIVAYPYEDRMGKTGSTRNQSVPGFTSVHFNFLTDRLNPGDSNAWQLVSREESIEISSGNSADANDPVRELSSDGSQVFDLRLPGPDECTGISLPFKITVERFDVIVQQ